MTNQQPVTWMPLKDLQPFEVPIVRTELPGPRSQELWERTGHLHSPGLSAVAVESRMAMHEGYGCLVRDVDGNVLIDFCSGAVVNIIGHSHPRVVEAVQMELQKFVHIYDWMTESRADFFEELAKLLPESLNRFQMYTSGTETVEAALRVAQSATGKREIISLYRGFHGKTTGSRALLGGGYKKGWGTPAPGIYHTMNPYCYRCPLKLEPETCGAACADMVQHVFEQQSSGEVAALIMEPIQGAGGVIPLPKQFVDKMKAFCDKNKILLLFDEILTSAGRTGKMWAHEHTGVVPDIMTMGKGIGGGYPLGMVAARADLMEQWPWNQPFGGTTTFGGGNVAAVAGLVTLKVIQEEGLVENGARVGKFMKDAMLAMKEKYDVIGDVRGEGMLMALEFVKDRNTKEPITGEQATYFFHRTLEKGLMINSFGPITRITPPIIMTEELAAKGLEILDYAIGKLQERVTLDKGV